MQLTDGYRLIALRNAQRFLADHADDLPRVVQTGASRRLDTILDELSSIVTEQAEATLLARAATGRLHHLRRRLFEEHLTPIARVARAELVDHPELCAFQMPRATTPAVRLAAAASGMARAARPHAAVFVAAGLPDDFVARLEEAVDEMLEAYMTRASWRGRVSGATAGITIRLAAGRRMVAVLDSLVRLATRDRRELRAAWREASAIAAVPGRRRLSSGARDDSPVRLLAATTSPVIEASDDAASLGQNRSLLLPASGSPSEPLASAG